MNSPSIVQPYVDFPRFFKIGGVWINSYKVFLIVGIYVGSLTSARLAEQTGSSPLRVGLGAMTCALAGLIGARVYHLVLHASHYRKRRSLKALWDTSRGGWGIFGALLTFVPVSFGVASLLGLSVVQFFDLMSGGVLAGGFWIRLGCVFNGCCVGRPTSSRFGVLLHDIEGTRKRRVPAQFLEMAWWLLGSLLFLAVWPRPLPAGSYALGVLAWYGFGRFFLEPLREESERILGRVRVNQLVAGLLAGGAGSALVIRIWSF